MHRIDTATATVDDLFTNGDPGTGVPPTECDDDWLNDVQENIAQTIEAAGIALVKGDGTQLLDAIRALAPAYKRERNPASKTTLSDFQTGKYSIGVEPSVRGDLILSGLMDKAYSMVYGVNVTVAANGAVTIPVKAVAKAAYLYVDGTLIDSIATGSIDSGGSITWAAKNLAWTATAGNHLVQILYTTGATGYSAASGGMVVGEWIDGTNVMFLSTP